MIRMIKFYSPCIFCFWMLIISLGAANPAFCQLSLVSSTPVDGEINVNTVATFTFTFSEALDTTARFQEGPDFLPFLALELYPDSAGMPEDVGISVDLKTITIVNVPLTPDTRFFLFLSGARSSIGGGLDRPYAITFTTSNSLPTATVSGTINYPDGDASGTAIALFEQSPFSEGAGVIVAGGIVPLGSGNSGNSTTLGTGAFTINYVPAGEYLVLAIKDVNMDGELEFSDDAFGGYDSNADKVADFIVVGDGANITNIDMDIKISQAVTAGENASASETIVQTQAADAALTAVVGGELSPAGDGLSQIWNYLYYSANEDSLFSVVSWGDLFFFSPFVFGDDGDSGDGGPEPIINLPLPDNWIDSDVAADSAWANGGADFVNANPNPNINATLFNLPLSGPGMISNSRLWANNSQYIDRNYLNHFKKTSADTDTIAVWVFSFFSDSTGQFFGIGIDALTGSPIEFGPGPGSPATAMDNLDAVNQVALNWASDAALIQIGNVDYLDPQGFAHAWAYAYYSAGKDSIRAFYMVSGNVVFEKYVENNQVPSLEMLPGSFCNSTDVSPIAEQNSGNFRNIHAETFVRAILSRGYLPGDPTRAIWIFDYFSNADQTQLILYIDAMTCDIITEIEDNSDLANLPSKYDLAQNYPNPFNPTTVINYQILQPGQTKLMIYNQLGQIVRILVDEIKNPGVYKAIWNGLDENGNQVPNGVYFYRLDSNEFTQTMKMVLMR